MPRLQTGVFQTVVTVACGQYVLVLRYSADPLKAVSGLRLVPYPRAILKIRPPCSLDYRARHRP